jgi:hypothetical protein
MKGPGEAAGPVGALARTAGAASKRGDLRFRLINPAFAPDAAAKLQIPIKLGHILIAHRGELPEMEHARFVELGLKLRTNAGELGEIVRGAARRYGTTQSLV